jgi:hypothetical protein
MSDSKHPSTHHPLVHASIHAHPYLSGLFVCLCEICELLQGCSHSPLPGHNILELTIKEPRPPRVKGHIGVEEHLKTAPTPEAGHESHKIRFSATLDTGFKTK